MRVDQERCLSACEMEVPTANASPLSRKRARDESTARLKEWRQPTEEELCLNPIMHPRIAIPATPPSLIAESLEIPATPPARVPKHDWSMAGA